MNKVTKAYALANPESRLKVKQFRDKIQISVPEKAPCNILPILVIEFKGDPSVFPVPTAGKTANVSSSDPRISVSSLFDGDPRNQWRAAQGEITSWIEVDLGEEISIWNMTLVEPWRERHNQPQKYTLQVKKDNQWVEVISGKTNGSGHSIDFEPVTGQYFKLMITGPNGTEKPALNELILNRAF
jgi:hypothetical protein